MSAERSLGASLEANDEKGPGPRIMLVIGRNAKGAGQASQHRRQGCVKFRSRQDVRLANILAAKAVSDTVRTGAKFLVLLLGITFLLRTSLGPRGMDKMIQEPKGRYAADGLQWLHAA